MVDIYDLLSFSVFNKYFLFWTKPMYENLFYKKFGLFFFRLQIDKQKLKE